jgi:hypothetical protein
MFSNKNDSNIVRNAMIVLFLSLLIVYVIWYQVRGASNQSSIIDNTDSITDSLIITERPTIDTGTTLSNPSTGSIQTGTEQDSETWAQITEPVIEDEEVLVIEESNDMPEDMIILSGTTLYFGPIEGIDKLWISYQYALKDDKNIYFSFLWEEPDLSAIARSLGGTLYTMNTETEIVKNELFGKRVIFINLPEYKDKLVLMYVEVGDQKRLLQISYTVYHQTKRYLQDLFTN